MKQEHDTFRNRFAALDAACDRAAITKNKKAYVYRNRHGLYIIRDTPHVMPELKGEKFVAEVNCNG